MYIVIRENFIVKKFCLHKVMKNFYVKIVCIVPVLTYTANTGIWHALEVDENTVARIILTCDGSIHYLDIGTATCSCRYWREVVNNY